METLRGDVARASRPLWQERHAHPTQTGPALGIA